MKNYISSIIFFLCMTLSLTSHAWVTGENVTVDQIIEWQDNLPIFFKLSNGTMCYIPSDEKNMYSLILSLMVSGKTATFHCHVAEDVTQGWSGHRLHRVIANR